MKTLASLSLDLDNLWSYMKTHGDPGWEQYPSYLDILVPRLLRFLQQRNLTITFFLVGQDAALDRNRDLLKAIADRGHEIGNHSFAHAQWFHLSPEQEIEAELAKAGRAIEAATGKRPIGFRGPGFSLSPAVLRVLARQGYLYDASRLATWLGPLARAYYFRKVELSPEELKIRNQLFGNFKDGFSPNKPYRWKTEPGMLTEIPVTTLPVFRTPFHVSYLLYLSALSPIGARMYFECALQLCRLTRTHPSLLLHPLDFLGGDDVKALSFFPGMTLNSEVKLKRVSEYLDRYLTCFKVVTLQEHASALNRKERLPIFDCV